MSFLFLSLPRTVFRTEFSKNVPPQSEREMEFALSEVDFRYADEEDSLDIATLINLSLHSESEGKN